MDTITTDSKRNCNVKPVFSAPTTFLMPISLARLKECTVERLIKLMQAIKQDKNSNYGEQV